MRTITLPSLVRMGWVVIVFGEMPAEGEFLTIIGHHRCGLTLSVVERESL